MDITKGRPGLPVRRRSPVAALLALVTLAACSDLNEQDAFRKPLPVVVKPDVVLDLGPPPDPRIFQPSKRRGGVLRLATSAAWPTMQPAATVLPEARNFLRNYARTLTVFRAAPPESDTAGMVVPDLAAELGTVSNGAKTWTYKLRDGIKYEDGTPVTAADIAYGVQQSVGVTQGPLGRDWFDGALETVAAPDAQTVVFTLKRPVLDFDELAQLPITTPVPLRTSSGSGVAGVLATGPYKFALAAEGTYRLVRNVHYDPATDPESQRAALPAQIVVESAIPQAELSQRLVDRTIDMQIGAVRRDGNPLGGQILGLGVAGAPVDTAVVPSVAYTAISNVVEPFVNEECRRAAILAANRTGYHAAYGAPQVARLATGLLPPADLKVLPEDLLLGASPQGDLAAARKSLQSCKMPTGFATLLGYRQGNAADAAAAEVLRTSLARVGITVEVKAFPAAQLYSVAADGKSFAATNKIGLVMADLAAPWPSGERLLRAVLDGSAAGTTANADLRYLEVGKQLLQRQSLSAEAAVRRGAWQRLDELAALSAFVLPGAWGQNSLHRPTGVTNLIINEAFGMYDYARLGKAYRS